MKEFINMILVLWHARRIQDYLWNKPGERTNDFTEPSSYEDWINNLQSRINKLRNVSSQNRSWKVEARKRALQLAAVSIALISAINNGTAPKDN